MTSFFQDVRFAIRDLRKGFLITALAVVSLAIAIGGNTVVFGLVNALLFRPLPYPDAERIVLLGEREENAPTTLTTSPANLVDWRERNRSFTDMAGFRLAPMAFGAGERPEPVLAAQVTPGFFEILGVEPLRGRNLRIEDGRAGAAPVVLLGYLFWQDRFENGRDPTGETLVLNRQSHTIIGVLPREFEFFNPQVRLWTPLSLDFETLSRDQRDTLVVARLRDGVTMEQAKADMSNLHRGLESEYPESNRGFVVDTLNFRTEIPDRRGRFFFGLVQGAVVFVLLIACVNIANLLLARTQSRRREIALRTALGAGRVRILRQMLTESLLLAACGGALGLALGVVGLRLVSRGFADVLPNYWVPTVDARVTAVTLTLTALAGILFGLSPAWMSFKVNLTEAMKEGGRGSAGGSRRVVSRGLVVAEIALSIVLLGVGSVLVQSFLTMRHSDPGFDVSPLLAITLSLPQGDDIDPVAITDRLIAEAARLPGVEGVAATSALPQNIFITTSAFSVDGRLLGEDEPRPRAVLLVTSPEYLATLGFPVRVGRFFTQGDRADTAPVAVVSEDIAERHWPGLEVAQTVGRRITLQGISREIVGIVGDVQQSILNQGQRSQGTIYLPYAQQPTSAPFLLVRCQVEPSALAGSLRNELSGIDSRVAVGQIQTMTDFVDQFFVGVNFFNTILTGFGLLALLLAALGTYGVLAYNVAQRSQEFGVRMALGASPSRILGMVTRQGILLGVIGLVLGTPLLLLLTRVVKSILVYAPPLDPLTILAVYLVLFLATLMASFLPARRAASLPPVTVLRGE